MLIPFTKMQACGNDYIYLDGFIHDFSSVDLSRLAKDMCRRSFSVGADGVVMLMPSEVGDGKMRIFNADGSEGRQCGNALRCVGKLLFERGYAKGTALSVETASGVCDIRLCLEGKRVASATVSLGRATVGSACGFDISPSKQACGAPLTICGREALLTYVNMGNPHAVLFFESIEGVSPAMAAKELSEMVEMVGIEPIPDGVNVEIAEVLGDNRLKMRVFERGSGETLSCGTGAAATVVTAVCRGLCGADTPIEVVLRGGTLSVTVENDLSVFLTGDAVTVFEGVYDDGAFAQ